MEGKALAMLFLPSSGVQTKSGADNPVWLPHRFDQLSIALVNQAL